MKQIKIILEILVNKLNCQEKWTQLKKEEQETEEYSNLPV